MKPVLGSIRIPVGARAIVFGFLIFILSAAFVPNAYGRMGIRFDDGCPARIAHVLSVNAPGWPSQSLIAESPTGGLVKLSNCNGLAFTEAEIVAGGAVVVDDWNSLLCGSGSVRVVKISVDENSCVTYKTEIIGTDAIVEVPELGEPLAPHEGRFRFGAIRSADPRSTFLALISEGGSTRAAVTVFDGETNFKTREVVNVDGWRWYEIPVGVPVGSVTVENIGSGVGPADSAGLFAVAFNGWRERGSPRVIAPEVLP